MNQAVNTLNSLLWGAPALVLILGVGMYLTVKLGFVQLRLLPGALKLFVSQFFAGSRREGVSSFQALCTALGATVGTGNLIGVAGAICLGGPGAVFWMWICGFLGMATKYAEAALSLRYRVRTQEGYAAGPMYVISRGLPEGFRLLGISYALFGILASFGVGNAAQVNAVTTALSGFGIGGPWLGLAALAAAVLLWQLLRGGAAGIGRAAQYLVPLGAAGYILLCLGVLVSCRESVPDAFSRILLGAFSPGAVTGGMLGSAFRALRIGCSRGVFTNEAGMGTAGIAHGSAEGVDPVRQGLMGMVEVFLDTIVICTLTALVILVSGVPVPYGQEAGEGLTMTAFASVYGDGARLLLTLALILFAFATILGWSLYGIRCAEFLWGGSAWRWFPAVQAVVLVLSCLGETAMIWQFSELCNGLMAIPNLILLALLAPEAARLTKDYKIRLRPVEVTNADFHQCKPL